MDFSPTPDQRIVQGAPATLEVIFTDQNGEPAAAPTTVTVGVTRGNGTVLIAAGTATSTDTQTTGRYTVALTTANTATLDLLTVTWTSGSAVLTRLVEIVGGVYFTVAEARQTDPSLTQKYSDARIIAVRREVEEECELITGVAWVPRYRRLTLDGTFSNSLSLPDTLVPRVVRSVNLTQPNGSPVVWTNTQLAGIYCDIDGVLRLTDGTYWPGNFWPGNLVIEVEYGYDRPPADLKAACLLRLADRCRAFNTGIPSRATSYTLGDLGGVYKLDQASGWKTGIPDVDGPYQRYTRRVPAIA